MTTPSTTGEITLYTDGACTFNPGGAGGWAYVLLKGAKAIKKQAGHLLAPTTNNRAELIAAIQGVHSAKVLGITRLKLISDSTYVLNGIKQLSKWLFKDAKKHANPDLWDKYAEASEGMIVECEHIQGHTGNKWNEWCDKAAERAARGRIHSEQTQSQDPGTDHQQAPEDVLFR